MSPPPAPTGQTPLSVLSEQAKVLAPRDPGCLQIVPDDGDRDLLVSGNDDGPENPCLDIRAVTAFLPRKPKPRREKDLFEGLPANRRYSGHIQTGTAVECFSVATQEGLIHSPPCRSYPAS